MPHKKGVLHWTPDPIGEALKTIERFGVDSSKIKSDRDVTSCTDKLKRAAVCAYPGEVVFFAGTHVTSDSKAVIGAITEGRYPEWRVGFCQGLWVTDAPDLFRGMNILRWSFMEDLNEHTAARLRIRIGTELSRQLGSKYITGNEFDHAIGLLEGWEKSGRWDPVRMLSHQPFNIDIPELARANYIAEPHQAEYVRVYFTGKYASLDGESLEAATWLAQETLGISQDMMDPEDVCATLKKYGWDGVYRPMGISDPYVTIWNLAKVRSADRDRVSRSSLGASKENVWIPGKRFEAHLSKDQRVADIVDGRLKTGFFYLLRDDISDLITVVNELVSGNVGGVGRFKSRVLGTLPTIVDLKEGTKFSLLSAEDLEELAGLLGSVLSSMAIV